MALLYIHSMTIYVKYLLADRLQWNWWWLAHMIVAILMKTTANTNMWCRRATVLHGVSAGSIQYCVVQPVTLSFPPKQASKSPHQFSKGFSSPHTHYIRLYILYMWASQGHFPKWWERPVGLFLITNSKWNGFTEGIIWSTVLPATQQQCVNVNGCVSAWVQRAHCTVLNKNCSPLKVMADCSDVISQPE